LEEAISRGILPKAEYVSALYEFEDELARIQSEIEEIKSPEKRQQAQALFDQLSKRIDDDTKNLPNMLSKHMKVKNGKYIIFCKNIEDMQEKMEQAQKMFGDVNTNITTYAVSSKLRENEQTLSDFEQDNDENTLKLMYAVDMLNEGYHINDLDGVIMMRPTYSPTVYTQQLGRALSVRGKGEEAKTPLVIDLVNNFDSIRIIEDLCERLSQYESTGNRPRKEKTESGLIIHDKTKEFRDIAARITELSKRKVVTLDEKIEIFERFFEEGNEEIDGQTVFEGYPIGQWAIQTRSYLNTGREFINPTEEQLDKLSELGILERRIDSTIDEKIEAVIDWYKNHPDIDIKRRTNDNKGVNGATIEKLEKLAEEEGVDFSEIERQYDRIQRYHEYILHRDFEGKLTEEQREKCKEGGIGGRFGYTSEIEEIAERCNVGEREVSEIYKKYGSMDKFVSLYRSGKIDEEELMIYNTTLIDNIIDVDLNPYSRRYKSLAGAIMGERIGYKSSSLHFISSDNIDKMLETINEREQKIIIERFGLETGRAKTLEEVGEMLGISNDRIRQIEAKALRKLRHPSREKNIRPIGINELRDNEYITEEERVEIDSIQNGIWDSSLIFRHKENGEREDSPLGISEEKISRLGQIIEDSRQRKKEKNLELMEIHSPDASLTDIEGISIRTYNCLHRSGVETLGDLEQLTMEDLLQVRNLGKKGVLEVLKLLEDNGMTIFDTKEDRETEELVEEKLTGQDIGKATFDASTMDCDEVQQALDSEILKQKNNIIGETN